MNNLKIGSFLQALRKTRGLTQAELAEFLDVSSKTVSKWECGTALPELPMLKALAEYYGITVDEILNGEKAKLENADNENIDTYKVKKEYQNYLYQKKSKLLTIFFILSMGLIAVAISLSCLVYTIVDREHPEMIALFTYCILASIGLVIFISAVYILSNGQNDFEPASYRKFRRKKYIFLYFVLSAFLFALIGFCLATHPMLSLKTYFLTLAGVFLGFAVIFLVLFHLIPHKNY